MIRKEKMQVRGQGHGSRCYTSKSNERMSIFPEGGAMMFRSNGSRESSSSLIASRASSSISFTNVVIIF